VTATAYSQLTFSSREEGSRRLAEAVARRVPDDRPTRVLDLGCGAGLAALGLAELRPLVEVVGVDVSTANIAEAQRRAVAVGGGDRARFVAADYMRFNGGRFDLIYSAGVFHLITAPTAKVIEKLEGELYPGGLLMLVIPYDCFCNRGLIAARRILRILRGRALDRLLIAVGRRLYRTWPEAVLRERLPYMYVVPARLDTPALRSMMRDHGLTFVEFAPLRLYSIPSLKHRLTVFRKDDR
jgi:trans-aconitate 2-methyltransferase